MEEFMTTSIHIHGSPEGDARESAASGAKKYDEGRKLWKLVDVVRPGAPVWDSAQPAAEPEQQFKVGDEVEAARYYDGDAPVSFEKAVIVKVDDSAVPYLVEWASNGVQRWKHASAVRRTAPAPARAFEFGAMLYDAVAELPCVFIGADSDHPDYGRVGYSDQTFRRVALRYLSPLEA